MNQARLRRAVVSTLPVMTGYVFLGFGFGILMERSGFGWLWAGAMSLFIYAGSMQYVAIGLLTSGAGLLTSAVTAFVVNARHLFYGISMVDAYKHAGRKKPYLIFALTDETYSLVSQQKQPDPVSCFLISLLNHIYWVSGTILGSLAGSMLPINLEGVDFALTALFVTIFVEQWLSTRNHTPAAIGLGATLVCLVIFGSQVFLIPSMILISTLLILLSNRQKEASHA